MPPSSSPPLDPVGEALWAQVLERWDDDARHAAFIGHCRMQRDLGAAAARYRSIADDADAYRSSAERAAEAKQRLGGIATLALLELQASATTPEQAARPKRWVGVLALAFATLAVAVLLRACG
jgi:hypothetical protein